MKFLLITIAFILIGLCFHFICGDFWLGRFVATLNYGAAILIATGIVTELLERWQNKRSTLRRNNVRTLKRANP